MKQGKSKLHSCNTSKTKNTTKPLIFNQGLIWIVLKFNLTDSFTQLRCLLNSTSWVNIRIKNYFKILHKSQCQVPTSQRVISNTIRIAGKKNGFEKIGRSSAKAKQFLFYFMLQAKQFTISSCAPPFSILGKYNGHLSRGHQSFNGIR